MYIVRPTARRTVPSSKTGGSVYVVDVRYSKGVRTNNSTCKNVHGRICVPCHGVHRVDGEPGVARSKKCTVFFNECFNTVMRFSSRRVMIVCFRVFFTLLCVFEVLYVFDVLCVFE